MTDILFRRTGEFSRGDGGYALIRRAASVFCSEAGIYMEELPEIRRTDNGKPFFAGTPFYFSLSHTDGLWMCLFSEENCGLDVQKKRGTDTEKIAARIFTPGERARIKNDSDFFRFWCRREAFGKLSGEGLFGDAPPLFEDSGIFRGQYYRFTDFSPGGDIFACIASPSEVFPDVRDI